MLSPKHKSCTVCISYLTFEIAARCLFRSAQWLGEWFVLASNHQADGIEAPRLLNQKSVEDGGVLEAYFTRNVCVASASCDTIFQCTINYL